MRKIYIGYDLGDGESITDFVRSEQSGAKVQFVDMKMPDSEKEGNAIPTAYGYDQDGNLVFVNSILEEAELVFDIRINFKRRPTDLCKKMTEERRRALETIFEEAHGWPSDAQCPECCTPQMNDFREAVVTFTNGVFENEQYRERIHGQSPDDKEIVFCVGHPTRWDDLDVAIYKAILESSVLGKATYDGKKASLIMAAESRAAFLTVKNKAQKGVLPKGTSALLLDIGSSTIDITALTADSKNYQYNSGNNYLGARSIDYMIREMCMEKLKKNSEAWEQYQDLKRNNETFDQSITLACRVAKERMYSSTAGKAQLAMISLGFLTQIKKDDVEAYIKQCPVARVLSQYVSLPSEERSKMGNRNWMELFHDFLATEKAAMSKKGIKIGRIILTGSASQMPFVPRIVKEVYPELANGGVLADMDPSRTISKGLALVGPSNDKSKAFSDKMNQFIRQKLDAIIKKNIPSLADEMGTVVADIITPVMKKRVQEWKDGSIETLNDMNQRIKSDCSEANLKQLLSNNKEYKKTIEDWLKKKVGVDIALELKKICDEFKVSGISVEDLNIMTIPKVSLGGININPLEFMDMISAIVPVIAGVIAYASIATIMAVLTVVISWISTALASALFTLLVGMGPVGWTVLAGVVGIGVAKMVSGGFDSFKEIFQDKVMSWNLPQMARKLMTDNKINNSFTEANIPGQIEQAFNKPDLSGEIVKSVSANLKKEIETRTDEIKYVIESM